MPLLPVYSGKAFEPGYAGIEAQAFKDADRVNGSMLTPHPGGDRHLPRLSNKQVVAGVRAWRRAAARSRSPSWPIAYDLTIAGLGWRQAGDRFDMSIEHQNALAPPELLALYWSAVDELAERLDRSGTRRAPLIVDWTVAGYDQAARDAWHQMKAANEDAADRAPTPAPTGDTSGWGAPVLLLLLLLAAGETKRKKRHGKAS